MTFIKNRFLKKIYHAFLSIVYFNDLNQLANIYGTDKFDHHNYTPTYQKHFRHMKLKKLNILEIGIGGYDNPKFGGASLRMWRSYFLRGKIYGIDIYDKSFHDEFRIKTFVSSQIDENFLKKLNNEVGGFDIIIDDGSHINEHVVKTFQILFPLLKSKGIYVVEDTQTSYWKEYGGAMDVSSLTTMNYFKSLTDGINYTEYIDKSYLPSYLDQNIKSIHFYYNMIFVYKK